MHRPITILAALTLFLSIVHPSFAVEESRYSWEWYGNHYPTLAAAEAAMRGLHPEIEYRRTSQRYDAGQMKIYYQADRYKPIESWSVAGYLYHDSNGLCAPGQNDTAFFGRWCGSMSESSERYLDHVASFGGMCDRMGVPDREVTEIINSPLGSQDPQDRSRTGFTFYIHDLYTNPDGSLIRAKWKSVTVNGDCNTLWWTDNFDSADGLRVAIDVYCPKYYSARYKLGSLAEDACYLDQGPQQHVIIRNMSSGCSPKEGNPCSPLNGVKSLTEIDVQAPELPFRRYYSTAFENQMAVEQLLGPGWRHLYQAEFRYQTGNPMFVTPEGELDVFETVGLSGRYRSTSGSGRVLYRDNGWHVQEPSGQRWTFETSGQLRTITWPDGEDRRVLDAEYNESGQLLRVVSRHTGRAIEFSYAGQKMISAILPGQYGIGFEYDENGNLAKVDYAGESSRIYHYESSVHIHHLTGITDELGTRFADYAYDDYGRVTYSSHAGRANELLLEYVDDETTVTTNAHGAITTYSIIKRGSFPRATSITGPVAASYDYYGTDLRSHTDANGNTVNFDYDSFGVSAVTVGAGSGNERQIEVERDQNHFRVIGTQTGKLATTHEYNDYRQLVSTREIDRDSGQFRETNWEYHDANAEPWLALRPISFDGPLPGAPDQRQFVYYDHDSPEGHYRRGDLRMITDAAGRETHFDRYDSQGRVEVMTLPGDLGQQWSWHPRGWLLQSHQGGLEHSYVYDPAGRLVQDQRADGSWFQYIRDGAGRVVSILDAAGNRQEFILDRSGNRLEDSQYGADGKLQTVVNREFDQLGRMSAQTDGEGRRWHYQYDGAGNLVATTDPLGQQTLQEYTANNQLLQVTAADGGITSYGYDSQGAQARVVDPLGLETSYLLDAWGNRIEVTSPDRGQTTNQFDQAGRLVSSILGSGEGVQFQYDVLGRPMQMTFDDGSVIQQTYDDDLTPGTAPVLVEDAAGSTAFSYNNRGQVLTWQRDFGSMLLSSTMERDAADQVLRLQYPSGMSIHYTYDAMGRIASIEMETAEGAVSLASDIQYFTDGSIQSMSHGNGHDWRMSRDLSGYPTTLDAGGNSISFSRDARGMIEGMTVSGLEAPGSLTYDAVGRIAGVEQANVTYDLNGNRLLDTLAGATVEYQYQGESNKLSQIGEAYISHDAAGRRSSQLDDQGHGFLYSYLANGQLGSIYARLPQGKGSQTMDVLVAEYVYDAWNRRVRKIADAVETWFFYDEQHRLLGEYDTSGQALREYVWLDSMPVAMFTPAEPDVTKASLEPPPDGEAIILDEASKDNSVTGLWRSQTSNDAWAGRHSLSKGKGTFKWAVNVEAGNWEVSVRWVSGKKHAHTALYYVHGAGSPGKHGADQRQGGGQWHTLGQYEFTGSGEEFIMLDSGGGAASADAIRLVPVAQPPEPPEPPDDDETYRGLVWLHADHLNTPRLATDESGTVVWQWSIGGFGQAPANQDPDGDGVAVFMPLRFPGQYFDEETGLHYNHHRYYDPVSGRYLGSDPAGLFDSVNVFSYARENPLSHTDPLGLWVKRCARQLAGFFGGNGRTPVSPAGDVIARHDYLIISGQVRSFQHGGNIIYSVGEVREDETENILCVLICDDDAFDRYVFEEVNKRLHVIYNLWAYPGTGMYARGARNCQTWIDDVIAAAKMRFIAEYASNCRSCFN